MHIRRSLSAALLAITILLLVNLASPSSVAGQELRDIIAERGTCTNISGTTTIYDFDASGAAFLIRSDDYNGVGQATYTSIGNCGSTLFSGMLAGDGWRLDLFNQSSRTLWITPNNPINSSQPMGPAAGFYWQSVEAYSRCFDLSGNAVPFQNLVNGSSNCTLGVDFQTAGNRGTKYKLVMGAKLPVSTTPAPATGGVSVVCNAVVNVQCVNWTISPATGTASTGVSNLYYYGSRGLVFVGQYYNSFLINVTVS